MSKVSSLVRCLNKMDRLFGDGPIMVTVVESHDGRKPHLTFVKKTSLAMDVASILQGRLDEDIIDEPIMSGGRVSFGCDPEEGVK